jgi:hypothetical protein
MSDQVSNASSLEGSNRCLSPRRRVSRRVDVIVRRGTLGLNPDLAIGLVDISEDGLGVRLRGPVEPGDEVEIILSLPVMSKSWKLLGDVCWCNPGPYGTFVADVHLRRRLTHLDLAEFT